MKWALLSLLLIVVIFTSGCIGIECDIPYICQGKTEEQTSDVITIESMTITPSEEVRSVQTIRLIATVKNHQKAESEPQKEVKVRLYNDCGLFTLDGNVECRPGEGIDDTCTINPMYPLSTAIVEWKLKAKDVNVKTNCELGIYVEYAYTTHSTSSVTFVNKEEAEQWVLQGRNLDEAGSKVIGEGPVKSYVEVKSQPIMVNRGVSGEASGSAIMTFWIENKGDGMLKEGKLPLEQLTISSAEEKITTSSGPIKKCIKEKAGNQPIIFIDKKSPVYSCEIYLKDTNEVKIEKTYEITSDLTDYTYRFTKKKTVTVKPQIEV